MGGLGQLVQSLLALADGVVPRWVLAVALAVVVALIWPSVRRNSRTEEARKRFRTATRFAFEERVRREDEALAMVAGNADGLVSLADLALAEGRPRIVAAALAALIKLGKRPVEVRRLQRTIEGPQPATALEAVILVERLLAQGQLDEAARRLERARKRWPEDEDLVAVAIRDERAGNP